MRVVVDPAAPAPAIADIADRDDCERLVRRFYSDALVDDLIGSIFVDVAHLDLENHVPVITSFWETMLLGQRTYARNAFAVHERLHELAPLRPEHFGRWLTLWCASVDELFAGERAELAKAHATRIAAAFRRRLGGARDVPLLAITDLRAQGVR